MMTRQLAVPALMTLSLLASACAQGEPTISDEGEVSLESPEDAGKDDSVFGKRLRYFVRGQWPWREHSSTRLVTDTEVLSQTDDTVRVAAYRFEFALPIREIMEISVTAKSFNGLGELSTDMAFILLTETEEGEWEVARCGDRSYFRSVVLDPQHNELDARAHTPDGEVETSYSFEECGIPDDTEIIGMFPFPSSNWGNMEGYYQLSIDAECSDGPCPDTPYR